VRGAGRGRRGSAPDYATAAAADVLPWQYLPREVYGARLAALAAREQQLTALQVRGAGV
jgi:hypothetical protein